MTLVIGDGVQSGNQCVYDDINLQLYVLDKT